MPPHQWAAMAHHPHAAAQRLHPGRDANSPDWVQGSKFGPRRCRNGRSCRNRTCGFAHPADWSHAPRAERHPAEAADLNAQSLRASAAVFVPTSPHQSAAQAHLQVEQQPLSAAWWQAAGHPPSVASQWPAGSTLGSFLTHATFATIGDSNNHQQQQQQQGSEASSDDTDLFDDSPLSPSPSSVLGAELMALLDDDES